MTIPTYTLLCIGSFMFLLCFSIGFGRKILQDKQLVEATELRAALVTKSGEVGSQEMHHIYIGTGTDSSLGNKQDNINSAPTNIIRGTVSISISFPIIKIRIPILKPKYTVATINQLNEDKIKGSVVTPAKTNEFAISLGNDGAELEYNYQKPTPRTAN